jgi:hypothetical protein
MSNEEAALNVQGLTAGYGGAAHHRPGQPDGTPGCDHGHRRTERCRQVHTAESGGRAHPAYGGQGIRRRKGGHRPAS